MVQIEITSYLETSSKNSSLSTHGAFPTSTLSSLTFPRPVGEEAVHSELVRGSEEFSIPNANPASHDQLLELFYFFLTFAEYFGCKNFSFTAMVDAFVNTLPGHPIPDIVEAMIVSMVRLIVREYNSSPSGEFSTIVNSHFDVSTVEPFNFPFESYEYKVSMK